MVLALMYLGMFSERSVRRAWKSFDWDALDRLHEKDIFQVQECGQMCCGE